ncbi:MAG: fumarylacetoacetate hydrolase family protein [Armatimonadota bacterium]|nr:MAG: fumarylacetoacetate hydrolase family protein [Armatimonadota bacterium]
MKVVQFRSAYYQAVGLLEGEQVLDFTRAYFACCAARDVPADAAAHSILHMLQEGLFCADLFASVRAFIEEHRLGPQLTVKDAELLAPIPRPPRIIALGLNYAAHAEETGKKPPKEPIFFVKASTAVIGPGEPVVCPRRVGRIDHEVELAVVIGIEGRRISRRRAMNHVAGYTILNDVTARDMQARDMAASQPWFLSKSFDTFAPMGPCIALPDEIENPGSLDLSLRVNGELKQKSNTRDLIFDVPELIHRLSRYLTLEPGDIISTGTPSGISPLEPGDVMKAEIENIGVLRNPVVAEG